MAEIRIKNIPDLMAWKEPIKKLEKDVKVFVDEGCVALFCANGVVVNEFYPGDTKVLNQNKGVIKSFGKKAEYCFYIFNNSKPVDIKWGIGKSPVKYTDNKINGVQLCATAYGVSRVSIIDAMALMKKMPPEFTKDNKVSQEEIQEFIQREIISKVSPILSAELSKIGDYTQFEVKKASIGSAITNGISFLDFNGLRVNSTVVENIDFTDETKDVIERHRQGLIEPLNTRIVEEKAKQISLMTQASGSGKKEE